MTDQSITSETKPLWQGPHPYRGMTQTIVFVSYCHAKKHLDGTALVVAASPQAPASAPAAAATEKPDPDKGLATLTAKIKEKAAYIDEEFMNEFNTMLKTAITGEFDRCATVSSTSTTSTAVAASA